MGLRVIFLEDRVNRYSVNSLLGALESFEELSSVDVFVVSKREDAVRLAISSENLTVINFSFFTTQFWKVKEDLEYLKEQLIGKEVIFTAGGPHPSGDPEGTLTLGFDVVFMGEGEITFPNFLMKLLDGRKDFPSVCYPSCSVNLNLFIPFSLRMRRFNPIEITRGCPFGCAFCQTPRIFGRKVRHRRVETVVGLVEAMVGNGLKDVRFITPNALSYGSKDGLKVNLKKVEELLASVKKVKGVRRVFFGSFPSEVRPEQVTEEAVELIKSYCNNDNLVIGAQSGSERILKLCRRNHTVDDVYRAVEITVKKGLVPKVDFIFGFPDETEDDVLQTVKFIKELVKLGAVVHAHAFMPLPQTPFSRKKPKQVDGRILTLLNQLTGKGLAFGSWREQEKVAVKIYDLLKKRVKVNEM